MVERVKQNKSLVDIMLTARTCQEHSQNHVDSFVIVSSDSDFWGLLSSMPNVRFLVMIEHENCGPNLKNALVNAGIFDCYIDDFYSGNTEELKLNALFKEMHQYIVHDQQTGALKIVYFILRKKRPPFRKTRLQKGGLLYFSSEITKYRSSIPASWEGRPFGFFGTRA